MKLDNTHPLVALHLRTSSLTCIASNENGTHLLIASWDTLTGVFWDTKIASEHEIGGFRSCSN
ncbi:hypothetical protein JOM56_006898 [Amanita muscaria]